MKNIFESIRRHLRCLSFDGELGAHYLIGHSEALELREEVLRTRYLEYQAEAGAEILEAEDFEEFLDWLTDHYDYFQISAAGEMIRF